MRKLLLSLACLLLLSACATSSPSRPGTAQAAFDSRADELGAWSDWGLTGRLGIDDGWNGGSGRLDWAVKENTSSLSFRGAMGAGAWQIRSDEQGATLTRSDGTEAMDSNVQDLVKAETGMTIPVHDLQWWVMGLAAPESRHRVDLDEQGLATTLKQGGWVIEYGKYREFEGQMLPVRLEATRRDVRVKLAVSRWWNRENGDG